jgi:hypothetical protein
MKMEMWMWKGKLDGGDGQDMQCREYLYCAYTVYVFMGKWIFLLSFIIYFLFFLRIQYFLNILISFTLYRLFWIQSRGTNNICTLSFFMMNHSPHFFISCFGTQDERKKFIANSDYIFLIKKKKLYT